MSDGISCETMDDAVRIARKVLNGTMDPNRGCGLIGGIGEKLGHPDELMEFVHLAHLQDGHESMGFTAQSCVPDILAECRALADAFPEDAAGAPRTALIALLEDFVERGDTSLEVAQRIEGLIAESFADDESLQDFADDLAQYRPVGGDFLFSEERMVPAAARCLVRLRAQEAAG